MHYNLLNYRNTTNQCTSTTNDPEEKDKSLATIIAATQPDIFTINEMGANWLNPSKLLKNALNKGNGIVYDQAEFSNNSFSDLTNMLFFNSALLSYEGQESISKDAGNQDLVRVIDVYRLYLKDAEALTKGDTLFFNVVVAHLKAGSASADKDQRAAMTAALMDFLKNKRPGENYLMCGDFNIQSSSEECYQNLTVKPETSVRFYDPVDAAGSWNEKSIYANLHTQSTRVSSTSGGCFSGGGLDDRFDFILIGKELKDYAFKAKYIEGSYKALGQDSRRFNSTINSPINTSVSSAVSQALYDLSDHLPVILELEIGPVFAQIEAPKVQVPKFILKESALHLSQAKEDLTVEILDNSGRILTQKTVKKGNAEQIDLQNFATGIYLLRYSNASGFHTVTRFAYL
jgi:endonuclease/exonuclease/phosphatase family metal-dependent hydrolase